VIRSFEYSDLIQSREAGVLLYILIANIQNGDNGDVRSISLFTSFISSYKHGNIGVLIY